MMLRLATVALEDGYLYYVTENAHLIRGRADSPSFDEAIVNPDPLVLGAMASAAFPALFQARRIDTATTMFFHVDGGVREVLPQQAAVELGAQLIFNISVGPLEPPRAPKPSRRDPNPSFGDEGRLVDIAFRSLALATNEVELGDTLPRGGFADARERVLIHPRVLVHRLTQLDPGLIRINMAYGWFRAFDVDQLRRGAINGLQFSLWNLWADELALERRGCHALELYMVREHDRTGGFFRHGLLESISRLEELRRRVPGGTVRVLWSTGFSGSARQPGSKQIPSILPTNSIW